MTAKRRTEEERLQIAVVKYLAHRQLDAFHVPNEGKRSFVMGKLLKSMGLMPGVSDLIIMRVPPLAIELKKPTGRIVVTAHQLAFGELAKRNGWGFAVCRSIEDVERAIAEWYGQCIDTRIDAV